MRNPLLSLLICLFSTAFADAQFTIEQSRLSQVNPHWNEVQITPAEALLVRECKTNTDLIQLHLSLVADHLSIATPALRLSKQAEHNRLKSIAALTSYFQAGVFPQNIHYTTQTPIFVDDIGTRCAVGELIHASGHDEIVRTIANENNLAYLSELNIQYDAVGSWATENGFTVDELAWIQPLYQLVCNPQLAPGQTIHASCYGSSDGAFWLDGSEIPPGFDTYVFGDFFRWDEDVWESISNPDCLSAGLYKQEFLVSQGDTSFMIDVLVTIEQPDSIAVDFEISGKSEWCEASLLPVVTGGTPPYSYMLFSSTGQIVPFDHLCLGNYTLHILDSHGCEKIDSLFLSPSPLADCSSFCITDIALDSLFSGYLNLTLYFEGNSSDFINYPYFEALLDENGDTVATSTLNFFGHIGGTSQVYSMETSLTQLPANFSGTAIFHYDTVSCALTFPCISATQNPIAQKSQLTSYPNPFTTETTIQINVKAQDLNLTLYNALGQPVRHFENVPEQLQLTKDQLPTGLYSVVLRHRNYILAARRLLLIE